MRWNKGVDRPEVAGDADFVLKFVEIFFTMDRGGSMQVLVGVARGIGAPS